MNAHIRIFLAVGAALVGVRAHAAEPAGPPSREGPRALNGHVFQPSRLVTGPFTTTSFGTATVFGVGEAEAPQYDLQGNQTGTRRHGIAVYGQGLDLHLRLTPDLGLRFTVDGAVFSGLDGRAVLVAGATAQYGVAVGLTAGKDFGRELRIALLADAGVDPQISILVGNAVLNAIETGEFDDVGVFSEVNRLRLSPGASLGWAPSPAIGFRAEARYLWTRRISDGDESRDAQGVTLGGVASLDLEPLLHWPIAFQGSYRADLGVGDRGIAEVHQVGLGGFYSRRERLALGLEVLWRNGQIRPDVLPTLESDSAIGTLWFRYYW